MHYSVRKGISIEHSGSRSWENNCFVFTPHDIRIFSHFSYINLSSTCNIMIQLHLARELPWGNTYLGTTRNSYPSINWRHRTEWTFFLFETLNTLPDYHLKSRKTRRPMSIWFSLLWDSTCFFSLQSSKMVFVHRIQKFHWDISNCRSLFPQ